MFLRWFCLLLPDFFPGLNKRTWKTPTGYAYWVLNNTFDAEYSAHAILDSPQISKTQKCSRNGSPWLENQHKIDEIPYFSEPELMAAAVLVKTIVFDLFLNFWFFVLFFYYFLVVGESSIWCREKKAIPCVFFLGVLALGAFCMGSGEGGSPTARPDDLQYHLVGKIWKNRNKDEKSHEMGRRG